MKSAVFRISARKSVFSSQGLPKKKKSKEYRLAASVHLDNSVIICNFVWTSYLKLVLKILQMWEVRTKNFS
jgi:hypothetical protein